MGQKSTHRILKIMKKQLNKELKKHLKHSLKHHMPTSFGGFLLGAYVVKDIVEEKLSELVGNVETIQECIDIVESTLSF